MDIKRFQNDMKSHAADSKKGSPKELILEPFGLTSLLRQPGS